jgi:DNA repair protein RadC
MRAVMKHLRIKPDNGDLTAKVDTFTTNFVRESAGSYLPVSDEFVIETALRILAQRVARGSLLSSPNAVKSYLRLRLADLQYEVFCLLYLDKRHRLIAYDEMFRGTIDAASVHPREVVKSALRHNAAAIILCHNHPSGVAEPSNADELITQRLKSALELVDIRVIDHVIVSAGDAISFAESGLL